MTSKEALAELIAKVEAGAIPASDFDAFVPVFNVTTTGNDAHMAYRGSLDAALALHQAVLPGWDWSIDRDGAIVWVDNPDHYAIANAYPPARAWLLAILKALHEMEENK